MCVVSDHLFKKKLPFIQISRPKQVSKNCIKNEIFVLIGEKSQEIAISVFLIVSSSF